MRSVGVALPALLALLSCLAGGCALLPGRGERQPLPVVPRVDLGRYMGTWYEIARLPNSFQEGCVDTSATYTLLPDGRVEVLNRCRRGTLDGPQRQARGKARVVDAATGAKLKVTFFWPFSGDYWIIALDEDYRWVLVGTPDRRYLWILSRERTMDPGLYEELTVRARDLGFDTSRLLTTLQPG